MPPKGELKGVYFGTADGQMLGKLDTIASVEPSAEAEQYVNVPKFSQMEFSGYFTIERNNYRKMHGKPLRRGRANWVGKLFRIPKIKVEK